MVQLCLLSSSNSSSADDTEVTEHRFRRNDPPDNHPQSPTPPSPPASRVLPFSVVYFSGQDGNFPASELNKGILGRGWQSPRFCSYPQEIVVELERPSNVASLQILCHEYKIPSKVEIFASLESHWSNTMSTTSQMKQLGFVLLDSNDKTNHQARELKHISINCHATIVRLLLHSCFVNKMNTYNQVGIVALIITGDPLVDNHTKVLAGEIPVVKTPRVQTPVPSVPACGIVKDTPNNAANDTLSNLDSRTAQEIVSLQKAKSKAVESENYDEAKRLKHLIERRIALGGRIKELEFRKQAAVLEEDYDCAKSCKLEIEKIRKACNDVDFTKIDKSIQTSFDLDKEEGCNSGLLSMETNNKFKKWKEMWTQTQGCESLDMNDDRTEVNGVECSDDVVNHGPYDSDLIKQEPKEVVTSGAVGTTNDDLIPEPLSETLLKELEPILAIVDQYNLSCIYSRHWQLRDKGLLRLDKHLTSQGAIESISTIRTLVKVMIRALNDKVSNVFQTALQVLRSFVERYHADLPIKELHSCVNGIVVVLMEKLGHSNVRTRETTTEVLLFLAMTKEIGLNLVAPHLLKPPKTQTTWKPVLGRLQLLFVAIPLFGLQPQQQFGFSIESLMSFIIQSFGSPNGEVRNAAVKATVEVYRLMGPPLEKFLKGVKPAIHEVLIEKFEKASSDIRKISPKKNNCREEEENHREELLKSTYNKVTDEQHCQDSKENVVLQPVATLRMSQYAVKTMKNELKI